MIELLGKDYPWAQETLQYVTNRILAGHELTINLKDKEAWINKWQKEPLQIFLGLGELYVKLGIVGER